MQAKFFSTKFLFFLKRSFISTTHNQDIHSPYEILGVSPAASLTEIKKAYHNLSKIYHPDKNRSKDASEKFKAINNAYTTLKEYHGEYSSFSKNSHKHTGHSNYKRHANTNHSSHTYTNTSYTSYRSSEQTDAKSHRNSDSLTEEEKLYEEIFGKSYSSDPMAFYNTENLELRKKYEERLKILKQNNKDNDNMNEKYRKHNFYENHRREAYESSTHQGEDPIVWAVLVGASLSVFFLLYFTKGEDKPDVKDQKVKEDMVEKFREIEMRKSREKLEKSKENYLKSLGRMKKYSILDEPNAISTLIDYTIYPDIKIYTVPSTYFYDNQSDLKTLISTNSFEKNKLRDLKVNTAISYSLEAERCFKNIYVNVSTIKKSLQEKGVYEPPGIFIRFFGFIYIKLRKMPMILDNLKPNTEWISLFDLYIRYNSPLPAVNEDYYEFKVNSQQFDWLGNVTLNHRKIQKIYLKGDEKNLFLWRGNRDITNAESKYMFIWNDFYDKTK